MNAQFKEIAKEAFIIAYKDNFGNITISCEASGIGRTQYKTWLKDDPEFAKRLAEIEPEEIMLDFGEQKLMDQTVHYRTYTFAEAQALMGAYGFEYVAEQDGHRLFLQFKKVK